MAITITFSYEGSVIDLLSLVLTTITSKMFTFFLDPDKIIGSFIEAVAKKIPNEESEFRTVFSIMNQSAAEIEGKRIYSNTF